MKNNIAILLTAFLVGCSTIPTADDKLILPAADQITTERCADIPNPKPAMTMGELLVYTTELMIMYTECAMKHDALVKEAGGKLKLTK